MTQTELDLTYKVQELARELRHIDSKISMNYVSREEYNGLQRAVYCIITVHFVWIIGVFIGLVVNKNILDPIVRMFT